MPKFVIERNVPGASRLGTDELRVISATSHAVAAAGIGPHSADA
jgi:hypothetical protein